MKSRKARELAARIFNTGAQNVWISMDSAKRIKEAITSDDIRALIKENLIKRIRKNKQSRVRGRILAIKKNKGRKRGFGKRKGSFKARTKTKKQWIKSIRAIRRKLKEFRKDKKVDAKEYRKLYKMAKSSMIKNKNAVEGMIEKVKEQRSEQK